MPGKRGGRVRGDGSPAIPAEIEKALEVWGGIGGIVAALPPEPEIAALEEVHRACADRVRLKILFLLEEHPLCVCVIKHVLGIADSRLSYHLHVLRRAGLIEGEAQGTYIIYRISPLGRSVLGARGTMPAGRGADAQ
ncbi:MAG: metalloregulator ArsR/SmtB family transcription factor [Methanolinea sp.]|nr:metalloregulator ArsR/SmtB family transcription factor [Methanolinea sp.]